MGGDNLRYRDKERATQTRYFFLSFAVAFLSFALIFWGFTTLYHPRAEAVAVPEEEEAIEAYSPTAAEALTVLFMGTADLEAAPGLYVLARFDPAEGKVPILTLPPQTAVNNNGQMETLTEVYLYGGVGYTRDTLAATLGVTIDRYVRMDTAAFLKAADAVGSVEFDLDSELTLREDGAALVLNAGRQLLDGEKVKAILQTEDAEAMPSLELAGRLVAAIVNQRRDIALTVVADTVFERIINLIDTDIAYTDYFDRKAAAAHLAERVEEPAYTIPHAGEWSENGKLYQIPDTFQARIAREIG
jgi:anionic cell wall polymer biosynthesis LytR-Cps2A-Psr (LCP) family protein